MLPLHVTQFPCDEHNLPLFLFVFADGSGALESEKVCAWSQVEPSVSVFHMHDLGSGFLPGTPCSRVQEEAGSIDCFVPEPG